MSIVVKITELRYPGPTRTVSPIPSCARADRSGFDSLTAGVLPRASEREEGGEWGGAGGGERRVKHMVGRG